MYLWSSHAKTWTPSKVRAYPRLVVVPISRSVTLSSNMQQFRTNNPYEKQFGYSRAVRKGPFIFVSGTTSLDPDSGELRHPGSAYDQAKATFDEIVRAVTALGGTKSDIVRVRMFVAKDEDTGRVGDALRDALGGVGPAATMIVGARFVSSEMLVEIEADAVVL
ncbi:YjgF-like protein [Polyporus arcularius HHB13444]|uniref:YjgF-like protein n=1 Tax=Polyporus arcularius HHB13444 TaxID=1314778 RepID=A0A5C3PE63_9APHY|nr:YjgF-like protein [Polyporus arcularius HHB13444]